MKDFIKEVLEDPRTFGKFEVFSYQPDSYGKPNSNVWYGKARDRTGMTVIYWCTEGHGVTYFGKKLEKNITVNIQKDGGTRSAFNGYCFNKEDFIRVLDLTW